MFVWVTRNNIARLLLFCLVFFGFAERFLFENFSILTELLLVKLSRVDFLERKVETLFRTIKN